MTTTVLVVTLLALQTPIPVYIGPQVREGFIDVDQGVLDSIADIKTEVRKTRLLKIVEQPAEARVLFFVLGRNLPVSSGDTIGVPLGSGMTMNVGGKRFVIDVLLKTGAYERRFSSDDNQRGTWKAAGKTAAKDLLAWVQTNHALLK